MKKRIKRKAVQMHKYHVTLVVVTRRAKTGAIYAPSRARALTLAEAKYNLPFVVDPNARRSLHCGMSVLVDSVREVRHGKAQ